MRFLFIRPLNPDLKIINGQNVCGGPISGAKIKIIFFKNKLKRISSTKKIENKL